MLPSSGKNINSSESSLDSWNCISFHAAVNDILSINNGEFCCLRPGNSVSMAVATESTTQCNILVSLSGESRRFR